MIEHKPAEDRMIAMQLLTIDEGAFICNIEESDIAKMDAKESGIFVVIHYAIRLDAMFEGRYELHKTKMIETSSIDFYQSFHKKTRLMVRKGQQTADARKRKDG